MKNGWQNLAHHDGLIAITNSILIAAIAVPLAAINAACYCEMFKICMNFESITEANKKENKKIRMKIFKHLQMHIKYSVDILAKLMMNYTHRHTHTHTHKHKTNGKCFTFFYFFFILLNNFKQKQRIITK